MSSRVALQPAALLLLLHRVGHLRRLRDVDRLKQAVAAAERTTVILARGPSLRQELLKRLGLVLLGYAQPSGQSRAEAT